MNGSTDWISAAAVLGAGLALGLVFLFLMRRRAASDVEVEQEAPPRTFNPVLKGYLYGLSTAIVLGVLGYYGLQSTTPAPVATAPPAAAAAGPAHPQPQATSPEVAKLEKAVAADPENVDQRLALAKAYFQTEDLMGTFEQTKVVLAKNPKHAEALTYNAVVRMAMGQLDDAARMLDTATKADPKLVDAWVALASVRTQEGDAKAADAAIAAAIRQRPEDEEKLKGVLAEMRARFSAAPPAPAALPNHPPAAAPASGAAPSTPIQITLTLDDTAKVKSGVVYLIARPDGPKSGHPIAVKRFDAPGFPLTVQLSSADSMMGEPFPARVVVEARLDSDGDAGTAGPNDPKAAAVAVIGGSEVAMTLK